MKHGSALAGLALLAALGSLVACTTAGGDGFARDVKQQRLELQLKPVPEKPAAGLKIVADPPTAKIYLDGRLAGTGTALLDTSVAGATTQVVVEAKSYRPRHVTIESKGQNEVLLVQLEPITGFLVLERPEVTNADFSLAVDGNEVSAGPHTVLIGFHTVAWRQFGSVPRSQTVVVGENQITRLSLDLTPAEFALTDLGTSRRGAFNPELAGPEGQVKFRFSATGPGSARLTVFSPAGVPVRTFLFSTLTWSQAATWDGRDEAGALLEPGPYRVSLTGGGPADPEHPWQELVVGIDAALTSYLARPSEAPTPDVLGEGLVQVGAWVTGHSGVVEGVPVTLLPFGVRLTSGFLSGWDLALQWDAAVMNPGAGLWRAGLELGRRLFPTGSLLSLKALASVQTELAEGALFSAQLVAATPGPWRFTLAPGVAQSTSTGQTLATGAAALAWSGGPLTLVTSANGEALIGNGLTPSGPLRTGLELRWLTGPGGLTWSALATANIYSPDSWTVYAGIGVATLLDTLD